MTFQLWPPLTVTVWPLSRAAQWSELVVCSSRMLGVADVALEAGVRGQRAIDDLALRVDGCLGVVGVLGKPLLQKRGHASVLGAAQQCPERPCRGQLTRDRIEGVRHCLLDRFDGDLHRVVRPIEDGDLGEGGRGPEHERANQHARGGRKQKSGFGHGDCSQ